MSTTKNRINLTVNDDIYALLALIAEKNHQQIATVTMNLLKTALELEEDKYWSEEAEKRLRSLEGKKPLNHDEFHQ